MGLYLECWMAKVGRMTISCHRQRDQGLIVPFKSHPNNLKTSYQVLLLRLYHLTVRVQTTSLHHGPSRAII